METLSYENILGVTAAVFTFSIKFGMLILCYRYIERQQNIILWFIV